MNQDAQIFNDLSEEYLTTSEVPSVKKEDTETTTEPVEEQKPKKEQLNWANPRFSMSSFQLYETKTVHGVYQLCKYTLIHSFVEVLSCRY